MQIFWSILSLILLVPPQPFLDLALDPPNHSSSPPQPCFFHTSYQLNTENPTLKLQKIMIELNSYRNNILHCKLANSCQILVFVKAHFIYFIKLCAALLTISGLGGD